MSMRGLARLIPVYLLLAACTSKSQAPESTPPPTPAPIDARSSVGFSAKGIVVPAMSAELALPFAAPVQTLLVGAGDHVEAGEPLIVLSATALEYALAGAEAGLRSAQTNAELQRYSHKVVNRLGKSVYLTGPPEVRQAADARVLQAEAMLQVARGELGQATLRAPFAGTVVDIAAAPGQLVQANSPVLTLADLGHMQVETTDLSERTIGEVYMGQRVTVHIPALKEALGGLVTAIAPRGEAVAGDVIYWATITLEGEPAGLLWGMTAEVEFASD